MNLRNLFGGAVAVLALTVLFGMSMMFAGGQAVKAVPITDNLYLITGLEWGANVTVLVTEEGVLVVDAGNNNVEGARILEAIKGITDKPVKFVAVTHYHMDHTAGLGVLAKGATIVAQENCAKNMTTTGKKMLESYRQEMIPAQIGALKQKIEKLKKENSPQLEKTFTELKAMREKLKVLKAIEVPETFTTFKDKKVFKLGKEEIQFIYMGNTHTSGSAVVYLPGPKTLITGDMFFHKCFPYIDWNAGSDTANWITALAEMAKLDVRYVVPGHGEVCGKENLKELSQYLGDLRKSVKKAMAKGVSLEEMQKTIKLEKYSKWAFPNFLAIGVQAVYHELSKGGKSH